MTHQQKLDILSASVNDQIVLPDDQKKIIQSSLLEGFIKILMVEEAERKAMQPYKYFAVELFSDSGFAIWNSGGFNTERNKGDAIVCAGINGEHTRVLRAMAESNGRHLLTSAYQGCFILEAKTTDVLQTPVVTVYQVAGFTGESGKYEARCQKVFNTLGMEPKVPEEVQQRLQQMVELCGGMACAPNLKRMDWFV